MGCNVLKLELRVVKVMITNSVRNVATLTDYTRLTQFPTTNSCREGSPYGDEHPATLAKRYTNNFSYLIK